MQAKRSYSRVLAAAAATAFSLQANVATPDSPAINDWRQTSDDAAIMARVKAALDSDHQLLARDIEVSVRQSVVRLAGFVKSEQDLRLAELDAKSVPGVSKVDNEIKLQTASEPGSR